MLALRLTVLAVLSALVLADGTGGSSSFNWEPISIVSASVLGVLGLFLLILGSKLVKFALAVFGFATGLFIGYVVYAQTSWNEWADLAIGVLCAIILASLFYFLYHFALFAAGSICGAAATFVIFQSFVYPDYGYQSWYLWTMWSVLVLVAIIGGFLVIGLEKVIMIPSTAFLGSVFVVLCINYFAFDASWWFYLQDLIQFDYIFTPYNNWENWTQVSLVAILTFLSICIQLAISRKKKHHHSQIPEAHVQVVQAGYVLPVYQNYH
jgi:hypothetical protein